MCVLYDCYLDFLGLGLAFFGEDRLATLLSGDFSTRELL